MMLLLFFVCPTLVLAVEHDSVLNYAYQTGVGSSTYRGRFEIRLEGGVMVVTHFRQSFLGFGIAADREEIQASPKPLDFLIKVDDATFLLSAKTLRQRAVTQFNFGPNATTASVVVLPSDVHDLPPELKGEQTLVGGAGKSPYQVPLDLLPHAEIDIHHSDGSTSEMVFPMVVDQHILNTVLATHDVANFTYQRDLPAVGDGRFSFELIGNKLTLRHTSTSQFGFFRQSEGGVAPDPIQFALEYDDVLIKLDPHDITRSGHLTYLLPDAPREVEIGLNLDGPDWHYELEYTGLMLRNQQPGSLSEKTTKEVEIDTQQNFTVYTLRALETSSAQQVESIEHVARIRYHAAEHQAAGYFQFEFKRNQLLVRHYGKNALGLAPLKASRPPFDLTFNVLINGRMKKYTVRAKQFGARAVRLPISKEASGALQISVSHIDGDVRFPMPSAKLSKKGDCRDAFSI